MTLNAPKKKKKIQNKKKKKGAYLRISCSQVWYPTLFKLFSVAVLVFSFLPVRNMILIPKDCNFCTTSDSPAAPGLFLLRPIHRTMSHCTAPP